MLRMQERILSIFIDESGDFGPYEPHSPYYQVAMVLHDQSVDITDAVDAMDAHIRYLGYPFHAIHTGPLIRRESVYANDLTEDRKRLFNALFHFTRRLDIKYLCPKIKKSDCNDVIDMTGKLSKAIRNSLAEHADFWNGFDKVIVYYDNGQVELTKILSSVFNTYFTNVEFRKVEPVQYKLFQVADLICTMELLKEKAETKSFSKSETDFFFSIRDFKKNYLKYILQKHL